MNQTIGVNIVPQSPQPTLHYSQGDVGRVFVVNVTDYDIPAGATVTCVATKPSGMGFTVSGTVSGNSVTFTSTAEMTDEWGRFPAEIRIASGDTLLGTANFLMIGEKDPHPASTIDGTQEELIPQLTLLVNRVEAAAESVHDLTVSATTLAAGSDATATYDSANNSIEFGIPRGADGDVTRSEFNDLKSELNVRSNNVSLLREYETGQYRSSTNGNKYSNADYLLYDYIPVVGDAEYYLGITSNTHICFWDANKKFISGIVTDNMTLPTPPIAIESLTFTTPTNACYVSVSVNKAYHISLYPVGDIAIYDNALPEKVVGNLPETRMEDIYNLPTGIYKKSDANLFNKNVAIHGYYISEASGRLIPNASFAAYYMPVESGENYTTSGFNNNHYAILQADGTFITGGVATNDTTFTIPSNGKYLGVTCMLNNIDDMAICKGDHAEYSEFGHGALYAVGGSFLEVGAGKQYATIGDAVNAANNSDIIIVTPGTYHEAVDAVGKFVCIIGTSKDECILEYGNGDYSVAPIEMTRGVLKNLTIKAISEESSNRAYCLHNDNIDSANSSLYVENVKFINPDKACVGIGMRANSTLEFVNCEFIGGTSNAFYIHDWDSTAGGKNQNFIMKNCYAENNYAGATIQMQSQEKTGAEAFALFQRNIVINKGSGALVAMTLWNESIGGGGYLDSTDWTLMQGSAMNTATQLNYSA